MIKWMEATGKTEELAVKSALNQLGLDRDSVSVEILERAKKGGLFGFGSAPAKVKVSYEVPDEPAPAPVAEKPAKPAPAKPEKPAPVKEKKSPFAKKPAPAKEEKKPPVREVKAPVAPAAPEKAEEPAPAGNVEDSIRAFLTGLLQHMGVEAKVVVSERDAGGILVTLEGEKLGALIGHRGETLDAIQQLTNYTVNKGRAHRVRVHIDAESYRAKREESLKRLANKVAGKVVKYRRNITLEPMNAYERHVIHETLQDYPDVITYSTGTEPNRRTVVAFSRGKHSY